MIFEFSALAVCAAFIFLAALLLNIAHKNTMLISLYLFQSLAAAGALVLLASEERSTGLLYAAVLTLAVKGVMAPAFLFRLIRKYSAHFSAASYLAMPLTLIALAAITGFAFWIGPDITGRSETITPLLFASIFSAFLLLVNRRGALAAVVGILALENGVVLLSATLGASHTFALEFTIAFDIAVWIAIASIFLTMLYREFGMADADVRAMSKLTEE